jgi:hypothetical protein
VSEDTVIVITNHQPRLLLSWYELTAGEQAEFDYLDPEDTGREFFRYKGNIYDLHEIRTRSFPACWSNTRARVRVRGRR